MCERNRNFKKSHVFIRRSRVGPVETEKLFFYVKKPLMQIRGVADFTDRVSGDYKRLWDLYGDETCLRNFDEYVKFLQGRKIVTVIRFKNLRELQVPISQRLMRDILGFSRIPRGGKYLNQEETRKLTV